MDVIETNAADGEKDTRLVPVAVKLEAAVTVTIELAIAVAVAVAEAVEVNEVVTIGTMTA